MHARLGILGIGLLVTSATVFLWLNPEMLGLEDVYEGKEARAAPVLESVMAPGLSSGESPAQPGTGIFSFFEDFVERALPDLRMTILLGPSLLLFAGLTGWLAGWLKKSKNVRTSYTRKVFHSAIFTAAAVLQITLGLSAVVLLGAAVGLAVSYAVVRGRGFGLYEAIARSSDGHHRKGLVVIPYLATVLGGLFANLLFRQFSYVGYLVCGWGDAAGEAVGIRFGRHRYRSPSIMGLPTIRSLEGSLAVALVGAIAAFLGLMLGGVAPATALVVALWAGMAGALVEAVSNHGIDNLTIQVAASAVAFFILQ